MDDLTVVLCALTVVGVSAPAAAPFWPEAWGHAPSIGAVILAAGLAVFIVLHSLYWWRSLDEAAPAWLRRSHSFDPRSREGATKYHDQMCETSCGFDPRSREGATLGPRPLSLRTYVSIHAPAREQPAHIDVTPCGTMFRSTLPRGSNPLFRHQEAAPPGFDPRSREGATLDRIRDVGDRPVSIHAPAREQRPERQARPGSPPVSIHAPAREQPLDPDLDVVLGGVSIHAPAREQRSADVFITNPPWFRSTLPRGSNRRRPMLLAMAFGFDPRSREGATYRSGRVSGGREFRSTLPRGSNTGSPGLGCRQNGFDPRSREGATCEGGEDGVGLGVSIHAPAREQRRPRDRGP